MTASKDRATFTQTQFSCNDSSECSPHVTVSIQKTDDVPKYIGIAVFFRGKALGLTREQAITLKEHLNEALLFITQELEKESNND